MANEVLGMAYCPVCVYERAIAGQSLDGLFKQEIRKSEKSGKPYCACDECGAQTFARQAKSVRILQVGIDKPAAAPKPPETNPMAALRPEEKSPAKPAAPPKPVSPPKPEPVKPVAPKPAAEPTIFDWILP